MDEIAVRTQLRLENFLEETGSNVTKTGIPHAKRHADIFKSLLENEAGITVSAEDEDYIFRVFSFMVWSYAYGAWSNLKEPEIRYRLIFDTQKKIASAAAYELSTDKSIPEIVSLIDSLLAEFEVYMRGMHQAYALMIEGGYEDNINMMVTFGLKWLGDVFEVDDIKQQIIEDEFFNNQQVQKGLTEIEHLVFFVVQMIESKGE